MELLFMGLCSALYVDVGDLNSSPHACLASIFNNRVTFPAAVLRFGKHIFPRRKTWRNNFILIREKWLFLLPLAAPLLSKASEAFLLFYNCDIPNGIHLSQHLHTHWHPFIRSINTLAARECIKIKSDFIFQVRCYTANRLGKDTAQRVYRTTERGSSCAERNIYLSPFLGSVFLSSCMLLKQRKPLRT